MQQYLEADTLIRHIVPKVPVQVCHEQATVDRRQEVEKLRSAH